MMWFAVNFASAQELEKYDLGGASRPRPQKNFKDKGQYKRVHQSSLRFILRGDSEKSKTFLDKFSNENPEDAETYYMLGVLESQRKKLGLAEEYFKQALAAGLPEGRLIAGPRELLRPMHETELFTKLFKKFETHLVHGPLLGNVTENSASFWMRTATECKIQVKATPLVRNEELPVFSPIVSSSANDDFTVVATVSGLTEKTHYEYSVTIDGRECEMGSKSFRTFQPPGKKSQFKIAFGGGAGYVPENERMWKTIQKQSPDALLLLGDNVYIDDPESKLMQQYTYQRRQSRPEWRALTSETPVYTIWDDHDFSTDDSWGGADVDVPFWKKEFVFPIFKQNWANPGYGAGDDRPGCWYSFRIDDVDFIMLDCRYYRTNPKESPRSMLGPVQKKWLKSQLVECKGTFKVVCSAVPWDFRTKGDSRDTWNGFKKEHEEILGYIEDQKIEGVVLMSADRHRSDAWKLSRPNGYDFYEFNSSRLTNQHVHPRMEKQGALFSFNEPQSFGLVTFDTKAEDPWVKYEVVDIDGKTPHSITVKKSQLMFSK